MQAELNYKHLYYFWVAAKEGGMSHAAARLGMAADPAAANKLDLNTLSDSEAFAAALREARQPGGASCPPPPTQSPVRGQPG